MNKNYLIHQYSNEWRACTYIYYKDTHKLYQWTQYSSQKRYAVLEYIYDLENEVYAIATTGLDGQWKKPEYLPYDHDSTLDIYNMSEDMVATIQEYLVEKYDAKYILPKCILSFFRGTRVSGAEFIWLYDLQTLSKYRDTGFESLYMIKGSTAMLHLKPKQWIKLTNAQKKLCINKLRELVENGSERLPNSLNDLLNAAEDDSYLLRKAANRGLPEVCKITRADYDWLLRHKNDTPYGRRKSTKITAYLNRYAKYLEYEYTRERDVTDPYWRHNRDWVAIYRNERALVVEAKHKKVDDLIEEHYAARVMPKLSIDGYTFEVTNDAAKWRTQANTLHQCIISMQYYKKTLSTIVLCTKDDEPWATFEVDRTGNIIQSYKDEMADDMKPEQECTEACEKYIKEVGLIVK